MEISDKKASEFKITIPELHIPHKIPSIKDHSFSEYRKLFAPAIDTLFQINHYQPDSLKNFEWEYTFIKEAFIEVSQKTQEHPEILKEMLFHFCNSYINNRSTFQDNNFSNHVLFLNLLKIPELENAVGKIKDNINNNFIYPLISKCVEEEQFDLASQFIDIFLLPENQNINKFNPPSLLPQLIEKRAPLSFLLQKLNGWNEDNVLVLFKSHSLDADFIKLLKNKADQFNSQTSLDRYGHPYKCIETILNRDFIIEKKLDIINELYDIKGFNYYLVKFYISKIESGDLTIEQLEKNNDSYINFLKTEDCFKQFIDTYFTDLISIYPTLVESHIWSEDAMFNNVISYIEKSKKISLFDDIYYSNFLNNFTKYLNNPQLQKVLIMPSELTGKVLNALKTNALSDAMDTSIIINADINGEHFNTVNDFLKKYEPSIYCFKNFDSLTKIEKDKSVQFILDTFDNYGHYQSSISQKLKDNIYKYCRVNQSSSEFFYTYFSNQLSKPGYAKSTLLLEWLAQFKIDTVRETLIFDFENNHPLHILVDKEIHEKSINSSKIVNTDIIKAIGHYFNYDVYIQKDKNGVTLIQKLKQLKVDNHFNIPNKINEKNSFFKKIFNNNTVYQAIVQGEKITYITSKKDKLTVVESSSNQQNKEINNLETGNANLHSLVKQAHESLQMFQLFMDENSQKNINVEVKIKAENILLKNMTFLKKLDDSAEEIPFEDSYFLKNNLHKYLMQSLQSYVKALDRYEALYEDKVQSHQLSLEEFETKKEKLDGEALKQITLLDENFEVVKNNIIRLFDDNLMTDMKIQTRILQNRVEEAQNRTLPDDSKVARIR